MEQEIITGAIGGVGAAVAVKNMADDIAEDEDDGGGKKRARSPGRPPGGKGRDRKELMHGKRITDEEVVKLQIATATVLVVLPEQNNFYVPVLHHDDVIQKFMDIDVRHRYDFLELHCFLNSEVFTKMDAIYSSNNPVINNVYTVDYETVIDSQNIIPLFDSTRTHGDYKLPHVNYAIAAFMSRELTYSLVADGETTHMTPTFRFVTQDSILACFMFDQKKLAKFLAANFACIMECHDTRVFSREYLMVDGAPIFEAYMDWLSMLCMKLHMKIYPPISHTYFYQDILLRNKVLTGSSLPKVYLYFPRSMIVSAAEVINDRVVEWHNLSWDEFHTFVLGQLHNNCNRCDHSLNRTRNVVLKPIREDRVPSENLFLILDEETDSYVAKTIDNTVVFPSPKSWLSENSEQMLYLVEPFDGSL